MGRLQINNVSNTTVARRNFFVRPPEPPAEYLMADPLNSIFIGFTSIFNVPFFWTYERLANPHITVSGITGAGKSYFVKTFITRAAYVWKTNAIIIDWAGEYKKWVKQTGGNVIALGKGSSINLLDLAGMKPLDRIKQVMRSLEILTDIGQYPEQKRLTELAIEEAYRRADFNLEVKEQKDRLGKPLKPPTLKDVVKVLEEMSKKGTYEFPAELENAIYRLKKFTRPGEDFFARESTLDLGKLTTSGLVDIDLSGLPDETFRALAALTILQFIKEKMRASGWARKKGIRLIVVLDEAWKVAKEENSDAVMIVREGRKYNFALIVASQNPTDISDAIFSNAGTTVIFRTKYEKHLNYLQNTLGFSDYMREQITKFSVGQCLINQVSSKATPYSESFIIKRVLGVEPVYEYFLELKSLGDEYMARTISIEKESLRRRLRMYGLSETHIENISKLFDQKDKHMDIVSFVILLERYGLARRNITNLLKDLGLDDSTIINIYTKADYKKMNIGPREITQVILEE